VGLIDGRQTQFYLIRHYPWREDGNPSVEAQQDEASANASGSPCKAAEQRAVAERRATSS
jgi:hypothetical protein